MKKIFLTFFIAILSIFSFTENTFSANCNNQENDFLCTSKITNDLKPIDSDLPLDKLVSNMIVYLLGFLGLIAIIYGLYGAWNIFSAASDEDKVKKGKIIILRACIGLVVIFSAYAITSFVIDNVIFQKGQTTSGSGTTSP